jgi:hypothetical protein
VSHTAGTATRVYTWLHRRLCAPLPCTRLWCTVHQHHSACSVQTHGQHVLMAGMVDEVLVRVLWIRGLHSAAWSYGASGPSRCPYNSLPTAHGLLLCAAESTTQTPSSHLTGMSGR